MKGLQVKRFDEYSQNPIDEMNEFIKDKDVVDIKQDILVAQTGAFYSQYLVIYKESESE
ncbi:hypothetical protein [Oceanobacillus alkalisoli]|uniref:hypothetical protein n=1 Tax=Oceanobacillus alkalisoli TaxID=2925113 RepID=UPI001F121BB7|nr:hypothetical protein [Oceanobacillus alkalisoli]MCF3942184.1 hypothetical protein [Oceanobacillus alkalisoli]